MWHVHDMDVRNSQRRLCSDCGGRMDVDIVVNSREWICFVMSTSLRLCPLDVVLACTYRQHAFFLQHA